MIADDDVLIRAALLPRMAREHVVPAEAVVSEFRKEESAPKERTLSVGLFSMLGTMDRAHEFGCETANAANKSKSQRLGRDLIRPDETIHYRGSFRLNVEAIKSAPVQYYEMQIRHTPEPSREEHHDLVMVQLEDGVQKSLLSAERTQIIVHLQLSLYDPEEHICPCDFDIAEQVKEYALLVAE